MKKVFITSGLTIVIALALQPSRALFAIDEKTQEVIVAHYTSKNDQVRIKRAESIIMYKAISLLKTTTSMPECDYLAFKMTDVVCQTVYNMHRLTS
jgi:hypothetical protein